MDLLKQAEELQKEGQEVLKIIGLMEFLSKFAEPKLVGSMVNGLMVWRDIDIELVKPINEEEYWETVRFLFHNPEVNHKVSVKDFTGSMNPATPSGLYIEMRITYRGNDWKIDLWFFDPREEGAQNYNESLKSKLTKKNKPIILEIKSQIYDSPKYRKSIFSVDIYKAVLEEDVKDLEGFKKYLAKTGRSL